MWEEAGRIGLGKVDVFMKCYSTVTADDFGALPNIWDWSFMLRKFAF